ncbi:MAG TPA: SCO family protein [Solirubrobacteraceae bacterium]|nr:SCO family protein [Solirubrobacteraceae bacterium]
MASDAGPDGGSDRVRVGARRALAGSAVAIAVLLAVAAVLSTVFSTAAPDARVAPHDPRPPLATGTALPNPPRVPRVRLVDASGRHVSLAHWRGKWIVLVPSMTLCSEVCPMTTGALMQLRARLRRAGLGHRVAIVEATVDPWRDTPYRLRAYRRLTGADLAMVTGTPAAVHRLWRFFGVDYRRVAQDRPPAVDWLTHRPETFDVEHTDGVFIVGPDGRERVADTGMPDVHGRLSSALRSLLDARGRQNLRHPELPWTAGELYADLRRLLGGRLGGVSRPAAAAARGGGAAARRLRGSPAALAALHHQGGRLLGSVDALRARLGALRGYPVLLNAWASWCTDCSAEAPLLSSAAIRYGRRVAFVGVDSEDGIAPAAAFLRAHPTSYPSYTAGSENLGSLGVLAGLPTTLFIDPQGRVVARHLGPYESERALDADIDRYLLATGSAG